METFVNFTSSQTDAANFNQNLQNGATLNHAGIALSRQGDHAGAARVHRQALEHKLTTLGPGHISTAVSYNALGEALTHLGELDEAEENIKKALQIAINVSSRSDEGFYHENLAMVYETKGDLVKAGETRHMNAPDKYVCSYYKCQPLVLRKINEISQCPTCKNIFYCTEKCQRGDWKRHKKYCKAVE